MRRHLKRVFCRRKQQCSGLRPTGVWCVWGREKEVCGRIRDGERHASVRFEGQWAGVVACRFCRASVEGPCLLSRAGREPLQALSTGLSGWVRSLAADASPPVGAPGTAPFPASQVTAVG